LDESEDEFSESVEEISREVRLLVSV